MEYAGNSVSSGIAIGQVYLYTPFAPVIEAKTINPQQIDTVISQYHSAKAGAKAELKKIEELFSREDPEKSKIFTAHMDILEDVAIEEDVLFSIAQKKYCAEYAVFSVYDSYAEMLDKAEDKLIRERAADIRDVKLRLIRNLCGYEERSLACLAHPVIVAARDLLPSDTATLDRKNVLAIICEVGGQTSHSAIIARSYEIPSILGVRNIISSLTQGETVIVDALKGMVITQPSKEMLEGYRGERTKFMCRQRETKRYLTQEARMQDGKRIEIHLNIGSGSSKELDAASHVDGVGLLRSEFLYMEKDRPPTEEEQFSEYRRVLSRFENKPVTLRTLDIGGDKTVSYLNLRKEENPFLGNRALRLCFSYPDIFKTQLRAALRAAAYGKLEIMLPMVGSLDDIRKAKTIIESVKDELRSERHAFNADTKIGIMIEIPSIALIAEQVVKEVDFASIGTNDLCQYTLAADRMNPDVDSYYQSYHPALFRLIGFVAKQFEKEGKPLSVCGELGGDKLAPAVLIGLGISKLSMSLSSVAQTKKLITHLSPDKAKNLADTVKKLATAEEVENYLSRELAELI